MNGGNAIDAFLKMVANWNRDLTGTEPEQPDIERLLRQVDEQAVGKILVSAVPTFIQERGFALTGGSVSGRSTLPLFR